MAIFAPPLRRTLQELRDDPEERVWRKDIRSTGWDGGTDLSSADTAATKGYFVDFSADAAQFVTLYAGSGVEEIPTAAEVLTSQGTTSATFADLATAGPAVTVTTGTQALVGVSCRVTSASVGVRATMGFVVSSATTIAAAEKSAYQSEITAANDFFAGTYVGVVTLTAGSNVFTAKYQNSGGTGDTATFANRKIWVVPFR